jgi:hypothetical protein
VTSGLPDYTAEEVWPRPDGLDVVEFDVPGGMGTVAFQAIIRPSGRKPWIGSFWTEDYEGALTFLETWDAGPMVLACAAGNPHFFRADDPNFRLDLPTYPVLHRLRRKDLVILGDFTTLTAVDGYGLVWESPHLASDEIADLEVRRDTVEGKGNDASTGDWTRFVLSLETGELLSRSS